MTMMMSWPLTFELNEGAVCILNATLKTSLLPCVTPLKNHKVNVFWCNSCISTPEQRHRFSCRRFLKLVKEKWGLSQHGPKGHIVKLKPSLRNQQTAKITVWKCTRRPLTLASKDICYDRIRVWLQRPSVMNINVCR